VLVEVGVGTLLDTMRNMRDTADTMMWKNERGPLDTSATSFPTLSIYSILYVMRAQPQAALVLVLFRPNPDSLDDFNFDATAHGGPPSTPAAIVYPVAIPLGFTTCPLPVLSLNSEAENTVRAYKISDSGDSSNSCALRLPSLLITSFIFSVPKNLLLD
jgi:hypothetical protein